MFVLPTLIFPLVFGLAIYRLYKIPRKLWSGELRLPGTQHIVLLSATAGAYLVLLVYTIALATLFLRTLFLSDDQGSAYLALFAYLAAYPFVYFGAAWIFYYGLGADSQSGQQNCREQSTRQSAKGSGTLH